MTIRLGVQVGASVATDPAALASLAAVAEEHGYESLWTAEAYGADAITPLAFVAARTQHLVLGTGIAQLAARTPAMAAMTAMTLASLSNGRFRMGIGASGPQVVEGWHGRPYGRPLAATRDYVEVFRKVIAREQPLVHHGPVYDIPFTGPSSTGLGKPLKSTLPARPDIPVYIAALGPKNVRLACEIGDGLLPFFWSPTRAASVYGDALSGRSAGFDIAPIVDVAIGDDLAACRDAIRPHFALYIGGMGAKGQNFYHDLVCRYGFEEDADRISELFLSGDRAAAARAVPDALIDDLALVGPPAHIAEQLEVWERSPATTLIINTNDLEALATIAALAR